MPNRENLDRLSKEERAANGRKGGLSTAEKKRKQRDMREILQAFLSIPLTDGAQKLPEQFKSLAEIAEANDAGKVSLAAAIVLAQITSALTGDTKAAEFIRDTAGQKPVDKLQAQVEQTPVVIGGDDEIPD